MKFKAFVSLGNACKTRHQIDRYFSGRIENYEPVKGFFDWLWGPGIEGVTRALEAGLRIQASDLDVKKVGEVFQVQDQSTGYYFLHDFDFTDPALTDLTAVRAEMLNQLGAFLEKYSYLAEKTKGIFEAGEDLCFVHFGVITQDQFARFVLAAQKLGCINPIVLNVVSVSEESLYANRDQRSSNWIVRFVSEDSVKGTPDEWKGSDESWDEALRGFELLQA